MMREVAGIRDDLVASALAEAVRKQREVVEGLERLLNILLERQSLENLEQQTAEAERMARDARQLEQQQQQLQQRLQQAMRGQMSPAEQQIDRQLEQLAREQQAEARANARDAGARRPALENAMRRSTSCCGSRRRWNSAPSRNWQVNRTPPATSPSSSATSPSRCAS